MGGGHNWTMLKKILFVLLLLAPIVVAGQSGMNYYQTSQNNITVTEMNQTYDVKFLMDDIGNLNNQPVIDDIDGDGTNELLYAEISGRLRVWNWSGLITGRRESIDSDRGTYTIMTAMGSRIIGGDNNGNGCKEIAVHDSNGVLSILEYCTGSWTTLLTDSDRGSYRASPGWCDVDDDGDQDILSCTYEGVCRYWEYDSGSYSLNFTDVDRGSYSYGISPSCGNWSNSDWGNGFTIPSYEGVVYNFDVVSGAFQMVESTADKGNSYGVPYVGPIINNTEFNQIVVPFTNGVAYAWNCSQAGCVELDGTLDRGSYSYGGSYYEMRTINGQNYLFNTNSGTRPMVTYMDNASEIRTDYIGDINIGGESYIPVAMPSTNSTKDSDFIIYGNRYFGDFATFKKVEGIEYEAELYFPNFFNKYYSRNNYYGFLYGAGFACGQLDISTEEDECFGTSYSGMPVVLTHQNITKFDMNYYDDYEMALLDIMPRDAVQYLPEGETTTSCVNENENVFLDGVGGTRINSWITAKDNENNVIDNPNRVTDGILSTSVKFNSQNSVDYTRWDQGNNEELLLNLSKIPQLGMIKFYGYFNEQYDPFNFSIEVSDETCTYPDTNTYTTIFDETNSSRQDVTGSMTSQGLSVYFSPQSVGCVKITASGAYYNQGTNNINNYVTEIEGYYANDCTFYHVPVDVRFADVSQSYNSTFNVEKSLKSSSPNQFGDFISEMTSWANSLAEVINRIIIRRA